MRAKEFITESTRQHLDFDEIYGRHLKVTVNDGDPNKKGFSLVTPLNGASWNWRERPEKKALVKRLLNQPGWLGDYKYQQIIDSMAGNKFDPAKHLATENFSSGTKPEHKDRTSNDKINEFLDFVKKYLGLDELPEINFLQTSLDSTFGHYGNGKIEVVVAGRHQNDVFRTLAHELVHYKQELDGRINDESGETGSTEENEANSEAGVIMRHYNHSKQNALEENFADGRNPQDKGDSRRHGIPKGATIAQLKKIRSSDTASPRKKQLAHWQINMRQGKKK